MTRQGRENLVPNTHKLASIELRGVQPVPEEERHGNPRGLFGMWWGGQFVYVSIVLGALPVIFGLSLVQALLVILVAGTIGSLFVGLGSVLGPRTHTATIVNTRAVFGVKGNIPVEGLNWVTIVGWAAVNSVLATLAMIELFGKAGWHGTLAKVIAVVVVVLGQVFIAVIGRDMVEKSEKVFAIVSTVLIFGMLAFLWSHIHWTYAGQHLAGKVAVGTWLLSIAAVVTGPLSWVNYASDYTRYYADDTSRKRIVLSAGSGMFVSTLICYSIGALLATAVNMNNPIASLPTIMPNWYLVPFLFVVIWSCVANNVLNTYSAGLALLALHVRLERWLSVVIAGLLSAGFVYYCIFVSNFVTTFTNFLLIQLLWLAPWIAMELVDFAMRGGRYDVDALHQWGGGAYWYNHGVNWARLGILVLAMAAATPFMNATLIHNSWDTTTLGGADVSWVVGMVVGGGLYWLERLYEVRRSNRRPLLAAPTTPHPVV
jgi:NCS1 family nucleobase:cation symporter-1